MKITQEHYRHMEAVITNFLEDNTHAIDIYELGLFDNAELVKDLQKRFCFDILYASGLIQFVCDDLYKYLNDDHIYTALKSICPSITKRY